MGIQKKVSTVCQLIEVVADRLTSTVKADSTNGTSLRRRRATGPAPHSNSYNLTENTTFSKRARFCSTYVQHREYDLVRVIDYTETDKLL